MIIINFAPVASCVTEVEGQNRAKMAKTACICQNRSSPLPSEIQYPTYTGVDSAESLLEEHGYFVVRGLLSADEVKQVCGAITSVCSEWYDNYVRTGEEGNDWEEIANRRPAWKEGRWTPEPGQEELGFRRLFRVCAEKEFFARMTRHERILPFVTRCLGPDIKLLQSMCLLKPPGGIEKVWHQDNAYFRLVPAKVMGVWIALDPANCANGCMHMLPKSHKSGFYKHDSDSEFHIQYGMVDRPKPEEVMPVILEPGDALVFTGHTAHYTPANISETRRRSLQFHYAASECKPTKCPKEKPDPEPTAPRYFDCDPSCVEPEYWYYRKAEILVTGKEYGGDYI